MIIGAATEVQRNSGHPRRKVTVHRELDDIVAVEVSG